MNSKIWEEYLKTVADNDPWEIALRWARFAEHAVTHMDSNVARTREYVTVVEDLLEAVESKAGAKVDWLAEVMEPKTSYDDKSFFTDQYIYENDLEASNSHSMAIVGFSSCLAILSAWNLTKYKSQLWEDNKQLSVYPEIIAYISSHGYLHVFQKFVLIAPPADL